VVPVVVHCVAVACDKLAVCLVAEGTDKVFVVPREYGIQSLGEVSSKGITNKV